jgi:predicted MFS family arabinose efflux permease
VFAVGNGAASLTTVGVVVTRAAPQRAGFANAAVISGSGFGQLVMIAALAGVLVGIGWRSVFVWLALAHVALLPFLLPRLPGTAAHGPARARSGINLGAAARTRRFWVLVLMYAICGLDDFFVATHIVAFAQDRGVSTLLAGQLLALMGLTALLGVLAAGAVGDRTGPVLPTALAFGARVAIFGLVAVDQSPLSIAIFALVFGATMMVTAPLTILFVRDAFGTRNLGALAGLITMVHQIFGGIGAYGGALVFDYTGSYDAAFVALFIASALGLALAFMLRAPSR